ncbi:MAG: class II SORL domain-containing protein [Chloroflexota bacterium]|nr:class II SORL domain-containing protein [Chloroflexota bacterium]
MSKLSQTIQSADWKKEKHAPTITAPDTVKAGEVFEVKVGVGSEIAHPNTLEHHIAWITLYFQPEGSKFPFQIGHFEFTGHGAGDTFTNPKASVSLKVDKPGTLQATSFCNLHGLWENSKEINAS